MTSPPPGRGALPLCGRSQHGGRELGSFLLEIEGERAEGYFVRPDGSVGDHFEIRHGERIVFVDDFESGGLGNWVATP